MTKPNISKLSYADLAELHTQTEERMKALKEEARLDLLRRLTETASKEGFTLEEVVSPSKKKKTGKRSSVPKYANPSDPSKTWSGNGRAPQWLKDLEESGKNRDEFLIS